MFTKPEITLLIAAVTQLVKSAKRQQNTGLSPMIKEVWARQEAEVNALLAKIQYLEPTEHETKKK